jgi:hypothetical protein
MVPRLPSKLQSRLCGVAGVAMTRVLLPAAADCAREPIEVGSAAA